MYVLDEIEKNIQGRSAALIHCNKINRFISVFVYFALIFKLLFDNIVSVLCVLVMLRMLKIPNHFNTI